MTFEQKRNPLKKIVNLILNDKRKMKLQNFFWIYLCYNYIIREPNEFKMVEPKIKCGFIPVTLDNCHRVAEFRKEDRRSQFKDKLAHGEIGFFAKHNGRVIGSMWATINKTNLPIYAQLFRSVGYNEGVVTDGFVDESFRGMRVAAFLVSNIFAILLKDFGLSKVTTDVNVQNKSSIKMLEKIGFRIASKMLYISAFGKPILEIRLKSYI
jgi:ribosomal protein S18 acetylase RimI-like enzyme